MRIIKAGIGFGSNQNVDTWGLIEPKNIEEITKELVDSGVRVRDVMGYIPVTIDGNVLLVSNPPKDVQAGTDATKQQLGDTTPYGGKVEKAEIELFGPDKGYAAAFFREMDEFGFPGDDVLTVLNRVPGLNGTLSSPDDGRTLYLGDAIIRRFDGNESKEIVQAGFDPKVIGEMMDNLNDLVITYSIGLNPVDKKDGLFVATAVANVWPYIKQEEIKGFTVGAELNRTGKKRPYVLGVDQLGSGGFPTTVSNMVATALLVSDATTYQKLTGPRMPNDTQGWLGMPAFKGTNYLSHTTITDVVNQFKERYK